MILPWIYRLLGYEPVKEMAYSDRVASGTRLEVRAAVDGLKDDVRRLVETAAPKVCDKDRA